MNEAAETQLLVEVVDVRVRLMQVHLLSSIAKEVKLSGPAAWQRLRGARLPTGEWVVWEEERARIVQDEDIRRLHTAVAS